MTLRFWLSIWKLFQTWMKWWLQFWLDSKWIQGDGCICTYMHYGKFVGKHSKFHGSYGLYLPQKWINDPQRFLSDEVYGVMVGDQEAWWVFSRLLPKKLTWQWKIHNMYCLLKMVIFKCHVSFQRRKRVESLLSRPKKNEKHKNQRLQSWQFAKLPWNSREVMTSFFTVITSVVGQ